MPAPKGNKNAVGNRGGGGVCKYRPKYAQMASKACAAGFTDRELAELFGVGESTINKWKLDHVEFAGALKRGKFPADERVERSLFQRAIGYTYDTVKILKPAGTTEPVIVPYRQHVPPDVTACIFWLKNRRPDGPTTVPIKKSADIRTSHAPNRPPKPRIGWSRLRFGGPASDSANT